ncbi:CWC16 protein [Carpediemonas membranifera]|uniref:CWC16 protein n=1 Tax=Carpediemonas membranifera TaxID=201153 RepID=A0A8J6DZG6_9EUKA|nr:CWC16 protein [Carpediemonas membranifera]|eukprot:KAG9393594.1 CWC16 protein [Carpediemonas membranifera]
MGDRKETSRYVPYHFDASKVMNQAKLRRGKATVTLAMPMALVCEHCHNYINRNTKFNARKETLKEKYLGKIEIFRFIIHCDKCTAQITFKTNPQDGCYEAESGAYAPRDAWGEHMKQQREDAEQAKLEEETGTLIESMERRAVETARQMKDVAKLDAVSARSRVIEGLSVDAVAAGAKKVEDGVKAEVDKEAADIAKALARKKRVKRMGR